MAKKEEILEAAKKAAKKVAAVAAEKAQEVAEDWLSEIKKISSKEGYDK